MHRNFIAGILILAFPMLAAAQSQMPADLAKLPEAIRTLPWQSIDLNSVAPLEYDRALLILNHVLDEVSSVRASEADLMSAYIQQQGLGAQFASAPPPPVTKQLSYPDAMKVAVALLRGPLESSSYATRFSDTPAGELAAYQQMYDRTCQRRWSEVDESRHMVRCMSAFLQKQGKVKDYLAWAKTESERRQQQYQASQAEKRATEEAVQKQYAEDEKKLAAQEAKADAERQQMQQALASAQYQQQQTASQLQQTQQQNAQAQQQVAANTQQPNYPITQPEAPGLIPGAEDPYYGGYYYGGAPAYYAVPTTTSAWYGSGPYSTAARAETEARMSNWHGTPSMHGGGGGGFRR